MDVTPELFASWDREQQQSFLRTATGSQALAAGVEAVCGNCAEPLLAGRDSHQCDPAHLAETLAKLSAPDDGTPRDIGPHTEKNRF